MRLGMIYSRWENTGKADYEQCSSTIMQRKLFSAKTKNISLVQVIPKAGSTKDMENHFSSSCQISLIVINLLHILSYLCLFGV